MAVTALALRLWQSTDRSVRLSELAETTATALAGLAEQPGRERAGGQQLDPGQIAHAVGSGTLLVRSEQGLFGFVHQSVMEWLVAAHAAERLKGGAAEPDVLAARELSPLMADFLCDLAGRDRARTWASGVLASERAVELAKRNALLLSGRLGEQPQPASRLVGEDLRGDSLSGRDLRDADLRDADLREARLVEANLAGADLRGARLGGARLDRAYLAGADLRQADLTGASLLGVDLRNARLEGCRLRRAALLGAAVDQAALASVDAWGAALPDTPVAWQLRPAATGCQALAVSPGSDLLAVGASDGGVTLWDLVSGNPVRVFHAHTDGVRAVAFSPDGHHLASAGDDGTVRLWDPTNGRCLAVLVPRTGGWIVLRPDGTYTLDGDVTGELWWTAGLCRFEPGELDRYVPSIRRLPVDRMPRLP